MGDRYAEVLSEHRRLLRAAFRERGGYEVGTEGDSFFVVFADVGGAAAAAAAGQRALAAHVWPSGIDVRVRMGMHTGEPVRAEEGYVGIDIHRAARISATAHGGQIVVSRDMTELLRRGDTGGVILRDLGLHALKDLPEPEQLFQLVVDGLPNDFPPLRVKEAAPAAAGLPDYSLPPADVPCPYKGLAAFEPEDDEVFFGREELVARLTARVGDYPFLAVVGPSGSGKSSLVRAGLTPALLAVPGRPVRRKLVTPGRHPLATLEDLNDEVRTLVVVDQFEELFTLCDDEEERRLFVEALMHAARPQGPATVIICLRADFYGHCAAYPALAAALQEHQALVGSMTEEELRRAIERPAAWAGLSLEPGLVQAVLRDVAGEPGALPLLSHALLETWRRRSGRLLTLIGYLQSGGVQGAIAKTAEHVYLHELTDEQRKLARSLFLRLSALGEGTEDTRRRVRRDELELGADRSPELESVLGALIEARLITGDEHTVEVAHEALIRYWPRLQGWLDEDRAGHRVHRHLTQAAQEWLGLEREPGALYRGARLATALDWAGQHESELNEFEREFLAACREAQAGELLLARRRNRRLRILVAVLAVFLLVAAGSAVLAIRQAGRARHEARVADSQRLAVEAGTLTSRSLDLSLLLARAAHRIDASDTSRRGLLTTLSAAPELVGFDHRFGTTLGAMALHPDHRTLAIVDQDGNVRLWDQRNDRPLTAAIDAGVGAGFEAKFSPDGRLLAVAGDNGTQLFAAHTLQRIGRRMSDPGSTEWVAFSPDSHSLATSTSKGFLAIRTVPSGRMIGARLRVSPRRATDVAFTRDSRKVLVGTYEGTLISVDALTGSRIGQPVRITRRGQTYAVEISPDGKTLATGDEHGQILLWDMARGHPRGAPLRFHRSAVYVIAFSPDGRLMASSGNDGNIAIWDTSTGRRLGDPLRGHGELVFDLAFTGPRSLISVAGGELARWNLDAIALGRRTNANQGQVHALALSPDQTEFVTGSAEGGTLARWSVGSMSHTQPPVRTSVQRIDALAWGPRSVLAIGGSESGAPGELPRRGRIVIWSASANRPLSILPIGGPGITTIALSPDGGRLAVGDSTGLVTIWDLKQRRPVGPPLRVDPSFATVVAFSPDGHTLATAGDYGSITLWRVRDGARLWKRGTGSNINAIAWRPDGTALLAGGGLSTLQVLDRNNGNPIVSPAAPDVGEIGAIAISEDGTQAAIGGTTGQIGIVDARTAALRYVLPGPPGHIRQVAFANNDRVLVSAAEDGTIMARGLDQRDWEREACVRAGRNLSARERRVYLGSQAVAPCPQWKANG